MYSILILPLLYYIIFEYIPIYGILIAFQDYAPGKPFIGGEWIGFKNFELVFKSKPFMEALRNTILISFYKIIWGFPFPITIALLLNEVRSNKFKRITQTAIYFPHFVSWVIVGGIIVSFFSINDGLVNQILKQFSVKPINIMSIQSTSGAYWLYHLCGKKREYNLLFIWLQWQALTSGI